MDQRQRRSRDRRTALHLFLESKCKLDASSLRVSRVDGEILAAVGDDVYADAWVASSALRVRAGGEELVVASSHARMSDDVPVGVRRILG